MGYAIRGERPEDVEAIRNVNLVAFEDNPHSRRTEHLIVEALRESGALAVSLVAIEDERVVGHIAFSPALIDGSEPGWFLVGPVAVLPEVQGRGIGSSLVETGIEELRALDARGCVLVGEPGFHGRLGFRTSPALSYEGVPSEFVLYLPLSDEEPEGEILADAAFALEPEPATSDASLEVP